MKRCISCNRMVVDFVEFPCPKCGKETIVRCKTCRLSGNPYITECGFEGP